MNRAEAETTGRNEGWKFLLEIRTRQQRDISREEYLQHGRAIVPQFTRVIGTQEKFLEGWGDAWREPNPPPAPVSHHPSRFGFCACAKCLGQ